MSDGANSNSSLYDQLKTAVESYTPAAMVTVVCGEPLGAKLLIVQQRTYGSLSNAELDARAIADARALLDAEKSETRSYAVPGLNDPIELFIETFPPPPTLLIFGAVHVAQALTRLAKSLGFRVIVTDARAKLLTEERFPEADQVVLAWPDEAVQRIPIEPNTFVAILTHDPKFDEPALLGTLDTRARYIGAVGSRKTNRDRRERLRAAGVTEESLARIRGPIGLNIGAETPEEMAISILAEIIAVQHGRPGGPLTEAAGNIRGEQTVSVG
jgi:xanthine dehydrogenase accessory factor